MKSLLVLSCALILSNSAFAKHALEATEPGFTAEKIELNQGTNSYLVLNPKYIVNNRGAFPILERAYATSSTEVATHLCRFLGMSGGQVISTLELRSKCDNTIAIIKNGRYSRSNEFDHNNGYGPCVVIESLECSPN